MHRACADGASRPTSSALSWPLMRRWVLACALLVSASACKKSDPHEEAVQRELGEERLNLLSNPSIYLEASDLQYNDDAEDTDTWQLIAVTVLNKSHFTVKDLQGDVTWLDDQGQRLGRTPIAIKGSVFAGNTNTFSLQADTLATPPQKGTVASASISFTRAVLVP